MMRTFDVDVFLRRSKQHLAVLRTFGEQPNAIGRLSVHLREFAYNSLCRVNSLPRQMPNNLQIYPHERTHCFCMPHSCSRTDVNPPGGGTSKRIIHWLGEQHFASCCNQGICSRADVDTPLYVFWEAVFFFGFAMWHCGLLWHCDGRICESQCCSHSGLIWFVF